MSEATKPGLPIWLILSIVLNALLIGLIIGGGLGNRKAGPPPPQGGEQVLMRGIDRAVPDEQRREVRRVFRQAFAETRPERIASRAARRELATALQAETYDEAAVKAALTKMRTADEAMRTRMQEVLAEQLGRLSVEQRRTLIEQMSRRERHFRRDRHGPSGDED